MNKWMCFSSLEGLRLASVPVQGLSLRCFPFLSLYHACGFSYLTQHYGFCPTKVVSFWKTWHMASFLEAFHPSWVSPPCLENVNTRHIGLSAGWRDVALRWNRAESRTAVMKSLARSQEYNWMRSVLETAPERASEQGEGVQERSPALRTDRSKCGACSQC